MQETFLFPFVDLTNSLCRKAMGKVWGGGGWSVSCVYVQRLCVGFYVTVALIIRGDILLGTSERENGTR